MPRWLRESLPRKLFFSYLLVIVAGVVTLGVAADVLAPTLLAQHLAEAATSSVALDSATRAHVEAAVRDMVGEALVAAAGSALLTAIALSLFVTGRVAQPVGRMVAATRRIAAGSYTERLSVDPSGDELAQLASSFNAMADALEQTERRRMALIGDVAHELRTPLATLEGYLEGLLDGVVPATSQTWATLHGEAGRLRRLVDDLQELSRAEARQLALVLAPVRPAAIVRTTLDRLRMRFDEKGLDLRTTIAPDVPLVLADHGRAVQALTNLLGNALRYTPAPGRVVVAAMREGDEVVFQVTDTGVGFPPEQARQLFERFYRVDPSRSRALGGSGIGLTISRALVEAMGGRIWAESPGPGRGSTFTFTLPAAH